MLEHENGFMNTGPGFCPCELTTCFDVSSDPDVKLLCRLCSSDFVVRQKNHRLNVSSYYSEHSQFAHDPPGHTCGLPCCNSDLYVHLKVQGHHAGCMAIPFLHRKIIQDNFTFRKHQRNLLTGRPTFTNGFHSLHPPKISNRKPLPKFGTTRNLFYAGASSTDPGNTLDHELSENQGHFLTGREITLPKNINQVYDQYHLKDFDMGESADVETSDSESSSDSSSDTEYYARIPSIKEENNSDKPRLPDNLIYPWDLLKSSKETTCKTKPDEGKSDISSPKIGRTDCKNLEEEKETVTKPPTVPSITGTQIPMKSRDGSSSVKVTNEANTERNQTKNIECDKNLYVDKKSEADSQNSKTEIHFLNDTKSNEDSQTTNSGIDYSKGPISDGDSQNTKPVEDNLKSTTSDGDLKSIGPANNNCNGTKTGRDTNNTGLGGHDAKVTASVWGKCADLDSVNANTRKGEQEIDGYNEDDADPIYYDITSDLKLDRYGKRFKISSPDVRRNSGKSHSLPVSSKVGGYETFSFQNNMFKNHKFKASWRQQPNTDPGTSDTRRHTLDRATHLGETVGVEVDIHEPSSTARRADVTNVCAVTSKNNIDQHISKPYAEFYIGERSPKSNKLHIDNHGSEWTRKDTKPPLPRRVNNTPNTPGSHPDQICSQTVPDCGINTNNSERTDSNVSGQFAGDKRCESPSMYLTCAQVGVGSPGVKDQNEHTKCTTDMEDAYLQIKRGLADDNDDYDQVVVRTRTQQNPTQHIQIADCVKQRNHESDRSEDHNVPCDYSPQSMQSDKTAILTSAEVDSKDFQERLAVINESFENDEDVHLKQFGHQDIVTLMTNVDHNKTKNGEMSADNTNCKQDEFQNQEQLNRNQRNKNNQNDSSACHVIGEGQDSSTDSTMEPPTFQDDTPITLIL